MSAPIGANFLESYRLGLSRSLRKRSGFIVPPHLVRQPQGVELHLDEFLETPDSRTSFVISPAGRGKTITSMLLVQHALDRGIPSIWLPMRRWSSARVRLEEFVGHEVLDLCRIGDARHGASAAAEQSVDDLLARDDLLVVFDGTNELADQAVLQTLKERLSAASWQRCLFVGRDIDAVGPDHLGVIDYDTYSVAPLSDDDIRLFVEHDSRASESGREEFLRRLFSSPSALEISRTPALLEKQVNLFTSQGDLFDSIGRLFKRLSETSYKKGRGEPPFPLWLCAISALAAEMNNRSWLRLEPSDGPMLVDLWTGLESIVDGFRSYRAAEGENPVKALARPSPMLQESPDGSFEFTHQSWQDFLAAYWLSLSWRSMSESEKAAVVAAPGWRDSIVFAGFHLDGSDLYWDLLERALADERAVLIAPELLKAAPNFGQTPAARNLVLPALEKLFLGSPMPTNRVAAFDAIYGLDADDVLERCCGEIGNHEHWMMRECAARFLGELQALAPQGFGTLCQLLSDECFWVRAAAAWALGVHRASAARAALSKTAEEDSDHFTRKWAQWALTTIDKPPSSKCMEWYEGAYETGLLGVREGSQGIRDYFLCHLDDPDEWIRTTAVESLPELGIKPTMALLEPLARDSSPYVRAWLMRGLSEFGGPIAAGVLRMGLTDPDPWVRVWSLWSVARLGLFQFRSEVTKMTRDPSVTVAEMARITAASLIRSDPGLRRPENAWRWKRPVQTVESTATSSQPRAWDDQDDKLMKKLKEVELSLRRLLTERFASAHGPDWESVLDNRSPAVATILRAARDRSSEAEVAVTASSKVALLDFTNLDDLFKLVMIHWALFEPVLGKDKHYWSERQELLVQVRNACFHHRLHTLFPHQVSTANGYADEFLLVTRNT